MPLLHALSLSLFLSLSVLHLLDLSAGDLGENSLGVAGGRLKPCEAEAYAPAGQVAPAPQKPRPATRDSRGDRRCAKKEAAPSMLLGVIIADTSFREMVPRS